MDEIVEQRTYLRNGIRLGEGDVVLDVGANVGVAAIFFAREGAGLVHCFEPVAPLFELLRDNVAGFPACVPLRRIDLLARRSGASAARPSALSCDLRTLSSVLSELELDRVDLLKIDVEGAELDVLQGIAEEDWPLIRQVVVEVHDRGRRGRPVESLLRRQGFHLESEQEPLMRGTDVDLVYGTRA